MSLAKDTTTYLMAGRDPPPLDIVVWNLSGNDDVTAAEHHDSMEYVLSQILLEEKDNLFILCQDKIDCTKHKIMSAALDGIPQNDGNTAIYYHSKDYRVKPVQSLNECLTVFCLAAKNGPKRILLASFHGKHDALDTSYNISKFNHCLKILEDYRSSASGEYYGVIVGGGVNLDAADASRNMLKLRDQAGRFVRGVHRVLLSEYQMPQDRENCVDYIIFWPPDIFNNREPIETPFNDYKCTKGQRPFDHPILMCRFMTNVQQVHKDVLAARFTDLDSDARRSTFGDRKFQANFCTWTERHKQLFFHKIQKAKQRLHDDGASIVFSFWDSLAWSPPQTTPGMCDAFAQEILKCLPKHEIFRARRMLIIKDKSGVCLQQTDRNDLFVSRGCKAHSLRCYHNSFLTNFTPDVVCVSVYGLFPLEGYAPLYAS